MQHDGGVFRQPENLAFDTRADGGVESGELRVCSGACFDPAGSREKARFPGFEPKGNAEFAAECGGELECLLGVPLRGVIAGTLPATPACQRLMHSILSGHDY